MKRVGIRPVCPYCTWADAKSVGAEVMCELVPAAANPPWVSPCLLPSLLLCPPRGGEKPGAKPSREVTGSSLQVF